MKFQCQNSTELLKIVRAKMPIDDAEWEWVAQEYYSRSGEEKVRKADDVQHHFEKIMANQGKPMTGTGTDDIRERAQGVYFDIKDALEAHRAAANSMKTRLTQNVSKTSMPAPANVSHDAAPIEGNSV